MLKGYDMIIAGLCSFVSSSTVSELQATAEELKGFATHFRAKVWLGGTTPEKYMEGIGYNGISYLEDINNSIATGTECHTPDHIKACDKLDFIWIGGRNSQNYTLLGAASEHWGDVFIKRGFGMTIDETIGLYDIMNKIHRKEAFIIERGINTFDRTPDSRWAPDLKGMIRIKHERPDMFENMVVDLSHSVGKWEYIKDTYEAFKAIGVKHWMVECSASGHTDTDKGQHITVRELKKIIR